MVYTLYYSALGCLTKLRPTRNQENNQAVFSQGQIEQMTEADVREEIIAPVVSRLGYRFGELNYAKREITLHYPYYSLGRKKKNEPKISGSPDYLCGVEGRGGSFVIEAKRGNKEITIEDIQQCHSYATHPEIQANYFVLCNGKRFEIYETLNGPEHHPIVSLSAYQFDSQFHSIESVLLPKNLVKLCEKTYDLGKSIGTNLGSEVKLTGGHVQPKETHFSFESPERYPLTKFIENDPDFNKTMTEGLKLNEFRQTISNGLCCRLEDGRIVAKLSFHPLHEKLAHNSRMLNIGDIELYTDDETISDDPDSPTVFETKLDMTIEPGTELFPSLESLPVKIDLECNYKRFYRNIGFINENKFQGSYEGTDYIRIHQLPIAPLILHSKGVFEVDLDLR